MIKYLYGEFGERLPFPKIKNKFPMSFMGPYGFAVKLQSILPETQIYLTGSAPDEGRIYFNSWRTREFICNRIVESDALFMCFASYDDEILPPFVGDVGCIEFKDNKRVTPKTFDKRRLYL
jgi:hypothetical protein